MDQGFNRLAFIYDRMMRAVFGKHIVQAQTHYLAWIPPQARILIIGGGTGWILKKIFKRNPQVQITFIDAAPRMIALAQKQVPTLYQEQVEFICANEQALPETNFDVIITFFFLDLFEPERSFKIAQQLLNVLNKQGLWLYADFHAQLQRKDWRRYFIRLMYLIANWLCQVEAKKYWHFEGCLEHPHLKKLEEKYYYRKMIKSAIYQKIF